MCVLIFINYKAKYIVCIYIRMYEYNLGSSYKHIVYLCYGIYKERLMLLVTDVMWECYNQECNKIKQGVTAISEYVIHRCYTSCEINFTLSSKPQCMAIMAKLYYVQLVCILQIASKHQYYIHDSPHLIFK